MSNFNLNNPMLSALVQAATGSYNVGGKKLAEKADKDKKTEDNISDEIDRKFEHDVKKAKPGEFVG